MTFDHSTAREAALRRHALDPDRAENTRAAREAWRTRYARQVDPDGQLDPDERDRRAEMLMQADMIALARRRWAHKH